MGKLCYLRPWLLYHRRASAAIIQTSFLLLDRKLGHYLSSDDAVSSKAYSAIANTDNVRAEARKSYAAAMLSPPEPE